MNIRQIVTFSVLQLLDSEVPVIRPSCLEWYPDKMGWQLNLTRKDIRRQEIYFKLHNFLISETDSGFYKYCYFQFLNFFACNIILYREH